MAEYILIHGIRIAKDFTPETFGRLITQGPKFLIGHISYQVCACKCGAIKICRTADLKKGAIVSCGCFNTERLAQQNTKHGQSKGGRTAEYRAWRTMMQRCTNPNNPKYKDYGARGIRICERWKIFQNFFEDMGNKPSSQHSIDRIDNDGDYCPENCRWATPMEQANNKRKNKMLTAFGQTLTLSQWSRLVGISSTTLNGRVNAGWDIERALKEPIRVERSPRKAK